MIIYGVIANESIPETFCRGVCTRRAGDDNFNDNELFHVKNEVIQKHVKQREELCKAFKESVWAILTPILIIVGIFSGLFTPTGGSFCSVLIVVGKFVYKVELAKFI